MTIAALGSVFVSGKQNTPDVADPVIVDRGSLTPVPPQRSARPGSGASGVAAG
jgi:hypothetical protein